MLHEGETHDEEEFQDKDQRMKIRKRSWYVEQIRKRGIRLVETELLPKEGSLTHDLCTFILQDGTFH